MDAKTTIYGFCVAIAALTSTVAEADSAHDVRCREIAFSQSAESRDAQAFAAFIDADARFVGAAISRGIDEIVAAWAPLLSDGGPTIRWRPQLVEVLENGTLALSRGPFRVTAIDAEGNAVEQWGTFNSVWRLNDDGQWRVVFDAGSSTPETPTDEQRELLDEENSSCGEPGL